MSRFGLRANTSRRRTPPPKGVTSLANIAIVNASTVCTDAELAAMVPDLQVQVSRDFAPYWGSDAKLTFVPRSAKPDPATWQIAVLDNSDQAGALGYHDLTASGRPLSKVFAATDKHYGNSVSVTISHELLEMLGDPGINMTVGAQDAQGNPIFLAYEACDACEADQYGYKINNTLVSDFVTPSWFGGVASTHYDFMGKLKSPFPALLPGGYIGVWSPAKGWTQVTAQKGFDYTTRAKVGSRRERRSTPRDQWILSQ